MNFIGRLLRKFKRRKVYSSFRDNIWGADLVDMQSLSNKRKKTKIKYGFIKVVNFTIKFLRGF